MTTNHNHGKSNSEMDSVAGQPANSERRKVLKKLAVGTVAVAGCSVLPGKWMSPVVEFGALPAHAVTSGLPSATELVEEVVEELVDDTGLVDITTRVDATYYGLTNGGLPTWYFWKPMSSFPAQFTLVVEGYATVEVINNGHRFEGGGLVIKESEVPGRGMGVITLFKSSARVCYIPGTEE